MSLSRRQFLAGGTLTVVSTLLAACGNSGGSSTTSATSATSATSGADATATDGYPIAFAAQVTDAGQYVSYMAIDFGGAKVAGLENDTFEVYMTSTVDYGEAKGEPYAYYDATKPLEVVKTEVVDGVASLLFKLDQAPTLTWLAEGRNYPAVLGFTVKQVKPLTITTADGRELELSDGTYVADPEPTSYADLVDVEVALFEDVQDEINYRLYKGTNDKLIVWFHGNGEGDLPTKDTNNNVAQILANRGGVAWVTKEAQEIFGDATVMAFQAPSMWYLAKKDGLLEICHDEIHKVLEDNGLSHDEVYLAGCSAGGFMSTRMIIAYPDLFKAAMINCPALDAANVRSETDDAEPTDDELKSMRDAKTAIWLVQGETDSSVSPELCAKRIWKILSDGAEVSEKEFEGAEGIASGFTTAETADGKYKLTLYKTFDLEEIEGLSGEKRQGGKIKCAEDYDRDGTFEEVKYNDHWTWVFTLRNNPEAADGKHIWEWAAGYASA